MLNDAYIYMEIPWGYFDVSKNAAFADLHKFMTFTREKKNDDEPWNGGICLSKGWYKKDRR